MAGASVLIGRRWATPLQSPREDATSLPLEPLQKGKGEALTLTFNYIIGCILVGSLWRHGVAFVSAPVNCFAFIPTDRSNGDVAKQSHFLVFS